MQNRISRCITLIGSALSLSSFAQVCNDVSLYKNGEAGSIEIASTFPEAPEWAANWGNMDGMISPYIRWSGMKDKISDWTGTLLLNKLPVTVNGGALTLKVRSTQKGKFGVWLIGDFGNSAIKFLNIEANRTYSLNVDIAESLGKVSGTIQKIGVGLFDVPAYQYTTLFVDDIALTCAASSNEQNIQTEDAQNSVYVFSDISPEVPVRMGKFMQSKPQQTSAAYTDDERAQKSVNALADFLLSESEHYQISTFVEDELSPQESRDAWFKNMYYVDRNRLKDSVIANPKALFYEANAFASATDNKAMPLLLGNVDYAYEVCSDTTCATMQIFNARILQAALPTASVNGSKIKLYYDPYFVCTNRKSLPIVEINVNGELKKLLPKTETELAFESAGVQIIKVKLTEGGVTINHNIYVEVK